MTERAHEAPGDHHVPGRIEGPSGTYELGGLLGVGGMGAVYRAQQIAPLRREVALKILRTELEGTLALQRFELEREAMALMDHPHIARVYDAGLCQDGRPYVAMELVGGQAINAYARAQRLDLHARIRLMAQVCRAVHHAHQKGVIHRDLKPANILVHDVDGRPVPKLIDFGLAKAVAAGQLASGHTLWGQVLGTPAYMSPEQADPRSAGVDVRSDVYALGVILHELLVGDVPLGRDTVQDASFEDVIRRLLLEDPEAPSEHLSRIAQETEIESVLGEPARDREDRLRGDLDWVVVRALKRAPDERYPSALALAEELERFLAHEPVEAGPDTRWYRTRKFIKRNRTLVSATAAVVVVLIAGLVTALFFYDSASTARQSAERALLRVTRLAAARDARGLLVEADEDLWPVHPWRVDVMQRWIAEAEAHVARVAAYRVELEDLIQADPSGGVERDPESARPLDVVSALVKSVEQLAEPASGALARVRRRAARARAMAPPTIEAAKALWRSTAQAVAADPRYGDWKLVPQMGLVPLGKDPDSGLQEFAFAPSGSMPTRDPGSGRLRCADDAAIVFVLVPPGRFVMGAQPRDEIKPNYHLHAGETESPVRPVRFTKPFFLAKHECTQAQWEALTEGGDPSSWERQSKPGGRQVTVRHPVESVSWVECWTWAERYGLRMPREAEWEYACAAGFDKADLAAWGRDEAWERLAAYANFRDRSEGIQRPERRSAAAAGLPDDGWSIHAPVGSYAPNAFGLHDMLGNVREMIRDIQRDGRDGLYGTVEAVDPIGGGEVGAPVERRICITRGGGWLTPPEKTYPAARWWDPTTDKVYDVGWRPARDVER